MSREEMNWLFRMIYEAVSSCFSTKPVTMSYVVHIAIQRITVSKGINDWIARKDTYSTTNDTTEKDQKNLKYASLNVSFRQKHLLKNYNIHVDSMNNKLFFFCTYKSNESMEGHPQSFH